MPEEIYPIPFPRPILNLTAAPQVGEIQEENPSTEPAAEATEKLLIALFSFNYFDPFWSFGPLVAFEIISEFYIAHHLILSLRLRASVY